MEHCPSVQIEKGGARHLREKSIVQISKSSLDQLVGQFEQCNFIIEDPIAIPHGFADPQDQEVIGLYAAVLAWGQRKTILAKMMELCERMRYHPYAFVHNFEEQRDGPCLESFKHRTFLPADTLWFTKNLHEALRKYGTLEHLFAQFMSRDADHIGPAIQGFSETMMQLVPGTPARLQKHLARPNRGSACKRLALYLRWMVRPGPVDLGIWTHIQPSQLVLPLDIHSGRQARAYGFLSRKTNDWRAVMELTARCRRLDPDDPCRYDYAFFGSAVQNRLPDPDLEIYPVKGHHDRHRYRE